LPEPVCPECGKTFDPADPTSYRGGPAAPWYRRAAGPPRRWHSALAIIATIFVVWETSLPSLQVFPLTCLFWLGWLLLVLVVLPLDYLLHAVASWRCLQEPEDLPSRLRTGSRRAWATFPLCGLIMLSVWLYPWPALIRFQLSRSAFEDILTSGKACQNQFVGLVYVESVERFDDEVTFFGTGWAIFNNHGLLYKPVGKPASDYNPDFVVRRHLGGSWYLAYIEF
jgi:hypothetical protein